MKKLLGLIVLLIFPFLCFGAPDKISLNFKDADIRTVLNYLAEKSGTNIVFSPEVSGLVSVQLKDIDWQVALNTILQTYDFGHIKYEDVVIVAPLDKIKTRQMSEQEKEQIETIQTMVFDLQYMDANDAKKAITPLLSERGKISAVEITGQTGWEFGGEDTGKRQRDEQTKSSRTKILVVSDISKILDKVKVILEKIDVEPSQILIQARIIEVNHDYLKDIGIDWGTGSAGASGSALSYLPLSTLNDSNSKTIGGHILGNQNTAAGFGPETTGLDTSDSGLKVAFRKLTGAEFETIVHALEEDVHSNTLSAPSILTLNNQEASILIGEKYPIVKTETSEETGGIVGGSLEKYENIGIQLNVVPQIAGVNGDYINMIIHPAVTSFSTTVDIQTAEGTVLAKYPRIQSREIETQILMKDGETVVIGGLLKDVQYKTKTGVPLLSSIPMLGKLFTRYTNDIEKVDLLIFITAKVVKPQQTLVTDSLQKGELEIKR